MNIPLSVVYSFLSLTNTEYTKCNLDTVFSWKGVDSRMAIGRVALRVATRTPFVTWKRRNSIYRL